jgi:hypothetical protein
LYPGALGRGVPAAGFRVWSGLSVAIDHLYAAVANQT